ncbi:MAG: diaminopimelate epimerase [Theionarchaea archaeon]|nr:diaminopimelate epimerase [Theionarchaea archaeon]
MDENLLIRMMKGEKFHKMSGAGNDFIVIDNRDQHIPEALKPEFARRVCTRGMSVGADGILLLEDSDKATFRMRHFNADSTEGEMCGNGARCIARFAHLTGVAPNKMTIETLSGMVDAKVEGEQVTIRLNPVTLTSLHQKITVDGSPILVHYLEEGTPGLPHAVVYKDDLTFEGDITEEGRSIRYHPFFPRGTNVNFCRVIQKDEILNRTYERGVEDETLACGTGSAAVAAVSNRLGLCGTEVNIKMKGGTLKVTLSDPDMKNIYLTGDARVVYEASLTGE